MKTGQSVIELSHVNFSFRHQPVLKDVNLSIEENELIGIFGPNGSGKTTLFRLIMGFLTPHSGDIRIFEEQPQKIRHRIGYVPQVHRPDPDFPITVAELIVMGRLSRHSFFSHYNKNDWDECEDWMERLGLLAHKNKTYGELSGGLAQRALLARALISNPDLILLDEPTANIDSASMDVFWHTIESLRGQKTILLVTHDLKPIVERASRFLYIQNQISILNPSEICEHFNLGLYHAPLANQLAESPR